METGRFYERQAAYNARRRERYNSVEGEARKQKDREWKAANKECMAAAQQRYKGKNPEKVAKWQKDWQAAHPDYNREKLMEYAKADPVKYLVNQARGRAKRNGIEFTLTWRDVTIPDVCPVLGISMGVGSGQRGRADESPSLDRFDPNKGYVPGNVRVISMRANWLKGNGTLQEFEAIVRYMRGG